LKTDNVSISEVAIHNTRILVEQAENIKTELDEEQVLRPQFPFLKVVVGDDERDFDKPILLQKNDLSGLDDALKESFKQIDDMIARTDDQLPDAVILAGQSSKMPLVKTMMEKHFREKYKKDVKIELPKDEDPKGCVAVGAAIYAQVFSSPDSRIEVSLENRTHSRLGIRRGTVPPTFKEIIPRWRRIPDESCGCIGIRISKLRQVMFDVLEHFGEGNKITPEQTAPVDSYTLKLPKEVPDAALKEARLEMALKANGEIELTAYVNGDKHKFTVEGTEPPFVSAKFGKDVFK